MKHLMTWKGLKNEILLMISSHNDVHVVQSITGKMFVKNFTKHLHFVRKTIILQSGNDTSLFR